MSGVSRRGRAGDLSLFQSVSPTSETWGDRFRSLVRITGPFLNWLARQRENVGWGGAAAVLRLKQVPEPVVLGFEWDWLE